MIIKSNDSLYNIEGWRNITLDDEYVTITYFKTYQDDEGTIEVFENVIELIDEDYYYCITDKHDDLDHKDIRQIKYRAARKVYEIILAEIEKKTELIDLDVLVDQNKLAEETTAEYLEEE